MITHLRAVYAVLYYNALDDFLLFTVDCPSNAFFGINP